MTVENRATSNMRKLRVGDRFYDENGELFEVTGQPELVNNTDQYVRVPMKRVNGGIRSRRYLYEGGTRVKLV